MISDYKYKIKKRQAFKIELLPAPKQRPTQGKSITHTKYFSHTKKDKPKICVPAHQMVYLANNMKTLVVATVRNNVFYWLQYSSKPESYLKFLS